MEKIPSPGTPLIAGVLVIGCLVVVTTLRPDIGWYLLGGVTAVTGIVSTLFGGDLRAEQQAATASTTDHSRGRTSGQHIDTDHNLRPNAGPLMHFCMTTAILGIVTFVAYAVVL